MARYVPLKFDGIEEGRFSDEVNKAFAEVQHNLIEYCKKHAAKARGAKAGIVVKIVIAKDEKGEDIFSIKASVQQNRPAVPASLTLAIHSENDLGQSGLFVRGSGSTHDDPKQTVMSTQDGKLVDLETGEVK